MKECSYVIAQEMKFFITDLFSKCDQTFNGKRHILCSMFVEAIGAFVSGCYLKPCNSWCPQKGHILLNKPAALS